MTDGRNARSSNTSKRTSLGEGPGTLGSIACAEYATRIEVIIHQPASDTCCTAAVDTICDRHGKVGRAKGRHTWSVVFALRRREAANEREIVKDTNCLPNLKYDTLVPRVRKVF